MRTLLAGSAGRTPVIGMSCSMSSDCMPDETCNASNQCQLATGEALMYYPDVFAAQSSPVGIAQASPVEPRGVSALSRRVAQFVGDVNADGSPDLAVGDPDADELPDTSTGHLTILY